MPALIRRLLTGTAAALLAVTLLPAPAGAAPSSVAPAGSTPVMVVLDASGSMNTADAPGPRIDAAKQAVYDLVDALPDGAKVGLEVYGTGTSSAASARAAGCRDIKQVVPVGSVDKAAFKSAVRAITARGYTPIGTALKDAAATLPSEGPRSIVLVSDGEDTCAPPKPCDVAKKLNAAGTDLTVHTIGFKVDKAARSQLTCIASVTGGSYRETDKGADLGKILVNRVGTALRPYNAVGTPVSGARNPIGAPQLEPGQYVDTLYTDDDANPSNAAVKKYYSVHIQKGETAYLSVTLAVPPVASGATFVGSRIELRTPDGDFCDSNYDTETSRRQLFLATTNTYHFTYADKSPTLCSSTDGQFVVVLTRTGDAFPTLGIKTEIDLHVEPVADASGLPGAQVDPLPDVSPGQGGTPVGVDGGSSFNNAPLLGQGTYTDSVVSGELRFYRVHLDWGQRLAYRIGLPATTQGVLTTSVEMNTTVFSPVRREVDTTGDRLAFYSGNSAETMHAATAYTVRYTNRASTRTDAAGYAVDGDYYIAYWSDYDATVGTLPLTMSVQVVGGKERGPVYGRPGPPIPTPSSASRSASRSSSSSAARSAQVSRGGRTPILPVAGGAAGIAVLAGAGALLWRRRRTQAAAALPPGGGHTEQITRSEW